MGGERGGKSTLGGLSGTQRRRRYEGDDMKREIRGWEETTQKKIRGGEEKRAEGGIEEKSVGALYTEKMTRGGSHGRGSDILGTCTQCRMLLLLRWNQP